MHALAAGLAALLLAGAARAADGDVATYPASFFAAAQPYSALDMVRRLPGFSLDEGDDEVRGLAGGAGNVLIDGERPATKEDLGDLLARMPAADVERIELIRRGATGVDMQGHQLLANVVRRRAATTSGQVEAGAATQAGRLLPDVRVQRSVRQGDRLWEASLRAYREVDDEGGDGLLQRRDAGGGLARQALYVEDGRVQGASLKASHERPMAGGRAALQLGLDHERGTTDVTERRLLPELRTSRQTERETLNALEVGANFERSAGSGELSATALQRVRRTTEREVASGDGDERFRSRATAGESVVGLTWSRPLGEGLQLRLGGEAAYNFLKGRAALEEDGAPVELPGARTDVREARGEVQGSAVWRPASAWTLEAGARFEGSRLRHGGEAGLTKELAYLKPRIFVGHRLPAGGEVRLRLEREAGQLDFEDFAAAASLLADVVTAGNARLEPETAWVLEAAVEQPVFETGAVVITWRHSRIDNVLDRIAVAGGDDLFDAPGNLGRGRRDELALAYTLPLTSFGVAGGLLSGEATWTWSSATDPTTGTRRRISGDETLEGEIHFSQDLPASRFRWGVDVELAEAEWEYRFDQVERIRAGAWVATFAEYAPSPRLRVRIEAGNLTRRRIERVRSLHGGPRDGAVLEALERRRVRLGPSVGFTLRRTL